VHHSASVRRRCCVPSVYRLPNVLLRLRHPVRSECVRLVVYAQVGEYSPSFLVRGFHPPRTPPASSLADGRARGAGCSREGG